MDHAKQAQLLDNYLSQAREGIDKTIDMLNAKEESLDRVWCAKVGCFYYLFRRFFLGELTEDTFSHCMIYIRRALNRHVVTMIADVSNSRDSQLKTFFFTELVRQKQEVHTEMKNLLGIVIGFCSSPPPDFPLLELLYDSSHAIRIYDFYY